MEGAVAGPGRGTEIGAGRAAAPRAAIVGSGRLPVDLRFERPAPRREEARSTVDERPGVKLSTVDEQASAERWPRLPDDTPQWTVVVRAGSRERDRYLDEEQRGLPWNA
ncbi:hypothetical protein [Dactylosporangium salmoneum]|uniref:hypothetical protein n=1 Tax=Dactylosporangium salmoneum TaxID=53361 RepID=UPI0031DCFC5F